MNKSQQPGRNDVEAEICDWPPSIRARLRYVTTRNNQSEGGEFSGRRHLVGCDGGALFIFHVPFRSVRSVRSLFSINFPSCRAQNCPLPRGCSASSVFTDLIYCTKYLLSSKKTRRRRREDEEEMKEAPPGTEGTHGTANNRLWTTNGARLDS